MQGVNKVILLGHLGGEPKVRYFESGNCVADFSIATTDSYIDKEGKKIENTEWHNIVVHGGAAQFAEKYLHTGDMVYVEGKIRNRNWDDKEGKKHYITEIVSLNLQLLKSKNPVLNGNSSVTVPEKVLETVEEEVTKDGLPF